MDSHRSRKMSNTHHMTDSAGSQTTLRRAEVLLAASELARIARAGRARTIHAAIDPARSPITPPTSEHTPSGTPASGSSPTLVERLLAAAGSVREHLARALDTVAPPPRRPTDLVQVLGLDKSLASRVHRAASVDESIEAVLDGAGVQGLRQTLEQIRQRAPQPEHAHTLSELAHAIDRFAQVCDEFPDGRVGLETVMADHMPEMRKVAERKARRAVFQSHAFLLGFHQDVVYKAFIRTPSRTRTHLVDMIAIELCIGLHKMRPGAAVMLCGLISIRADEPDVVHAATLDRVRPEDQHGFLIAERCSLPISAYAIATRGTQDSFALPADSPALAAPVDLGMGQILVNGMRRYASTERPYDTSYAILRKPVRTLVWDEFSDESLQIAPPIVTASLASYPGNIPAHPSLDNISPINQPEGFEPLGMGLDRVASRDVPDCKALLTSALTRAGVDPSRLTGHRLRIEYPVAHTRHIVWHRLPDPPATA